jgi:hypothetical protein
MIKIRIFVLCSFLLFILSACVQTRIEETPEITAKPPSPSSSPTISPSETPVPAPSNTPTIQPTVVAANIIQWISSSADLFNRVISVDPGNLQRTAYCSPEQIHLSLDGGKTWEDSIPTEGTSAVAQENGYSIFDDSNACMSVTLDPNFPDSFYTVFTAAQEEFGAPPVFYMGFFTTNGGLTWQLVPPPSSATIEDFGGFWNLNGITVEAMFTRTGQPSDPTKNILIQETADGGGLWQEGELNCPRLNPCVRWGPAASNIPGMGSPLPQGILTSADEGRTWSAVDPRVELRAPSPNQLAAFSDSEIAIISGGITLSSEPDSPPLRISDDGGFSWQAVALSPIPVADTDLNYFPGLQILPDGSYLSQSPEGSNWFWSSPVEPTWCQIASEELPKFPMLLQSVADQLWWIDPETNEAQHIALTDITCVGS